MLEQPQQFNITQSELASRIAGYFDNLLAQRDAILATYDLTPETAEKFCDLKSTDEDREKMLALYEKMVYVIEHKQIPPSEGLILERIKEQERINEFFGKDADIEVPPLPPTITPERIEQWKQKRFELRYLPSLMLEEKSDYPGWKKKPTQGLNFLKNGDLIYKTAINQNNPHLNNLAPYQLPGCWMLVDTRPKPHYDDGSQAYQEDEDIKLILQKLAERININLEAADGGRNHLDPQNFNDPEFWEPFYEYLGINPDDDSATIRLPRVIEQSIFGQEEGWCDTTTFEWAEECYPVEMRLYSRGDGNKFEVQWGANGQKDVGFRPLVVFSPH